MQKNNGMRPQDIVILLKILTFLDDNWTSVDISRALEISTAEISGSPDCCHKISGKVNKLALREFLIDSGNPEFYGESTHCLQPVSNNI